MVKVDKIVEAVTALGRISLTTTVHKLPVALVIASPEEADTCEVIFRSSHEVMTPQCSYRLVSRCGEGRPSPAKACPCT